MILDKLLSSLERQYLNFTLGEEQRNILLQVFKCLLDHSTPALTLNGVAGTGKTSVTKLITRFLELSNIPYVLASPTHKAKNILAQYTERETTTIHKLLNLSAIVDILELDFKDLQFSTKTKDSGIPRNGVLIVDECSMINDVLYDFIIGKSKERNCVVVMVGDIKQLQPVKEGKLSKAFSTEVSFELTKVYRQDGDNPILDTLDILRDKPLKQFQAVQSDKGSIILYNDWKYFIQNNRKLFFDALEFEDPTYVKLLAYTNRRVEAFNQVIRKELFLECDEYNVGDFLMGYDNCEYKVNFSNLSAEIINSSDYIIRAAKSGSKSICGQLYKG